MSDQPTAPLAVVRAFMAAFEKLDYDAAMQFVHPTCQYTNMPVPGPLEGPAGIRSLLEPFFAPTIENEFVVLREAEVGPVVFLERLDRHHLPKGWVELPVTGVFEVHDGLITIWRDYFDWATIEKGFAQMQ